MSDLQLVNDRLNALISNLSPSSRKEMARNIAKKLRASQQQNIKRQHQTARPLNHASRSRYAAKRAGLNARYLPSSAPRST